METLRANIYKLTFSIVLVTLVSLKLKGVSGQCDVLSKGGYIQKNLQITADQSPCEVKQTAIIGKGYTLTVQEGSELRFGPGVMLAVNGTLLAKVCMLWNLCDIITLRPDTHVQCSNIRDSALLFLLL